MPARPLTRFHRRLHDGPRPMTEPDPLRLRVGAKLVSRVCATQIVVVRAPSEPVDLRCGGAVMAPPTDAGPHGEVDPAHATGTVVGKRYVAPDLGLEIMCVRAGDGSVSLGDQPLELKSAKPLPTSD